MASEATITHVMCGCHTHLVTLDSWDDGDLYMQTWTPIASKHWGRFHWVWESLRGRWSGDNEVVFDRESATELRDALSDHLNRTA